MSLSLIVFYFLGVICLGGAVGVVVARNVVHASLLLLVSLMGVAGLFLLLLAEFLALVQVLIYGGAITIVILFVIMLTRVHEFRTMRDNSQWPLAVVAALAVFGLLAAAAVKGAPIESTRSSVAFSELGDTLFAQWAVPFEVASLVLLVALIGAIVIAREKEQE
ncbi:NADH-quinone oxidoreductase subunit J [SAR202 cluster bacterium AC-647-N09_OGT_505m]|nr:NADH-quinone oxidoreductase subunit J [SAR202 cluster bacterium AC-647-N09_OGT_505m]